MKEKTRNKIIKILLLIGIFIPIFCFIYSSSNYIPKLGLKANIERMKIIVYPGKTLYKEVCYNTLESFMKQQQGEILTEDCHPIQTSYQEGEISIAFKTILITSLILITTGISLLIF